MPQRQEYPGYVKLPGKPLYRQNIRFDFNFQVESDPKIAKINGFNLRMFTLPDAANIGKGTEPEIAITLTSEQWLDLIDTMRDEIDLAMKTRKELEDITESDDASEW